MQCVECVEELFLGSKLVARNKLDVVHHEKVAASVSLSKVKHFVVANTVDHFVHKPLAADVGNHSVGVQGGNPVAHSVQQVGFSKAG